MLAAEGPSAGRLTVLGACLLAAAALAAWLARTPARLRVDDHGIRVGYAPWSRSLSWAEIEEVLEGDRVDGVGWGYGWRWEGRGRIAVRVGGPMVTVVHRRGRLGVSVPDPAGVLDAVALRPNRAT